MGDYMLWLTLDSIMHVFYIKLPSQDNKTEVTELLCARSTLLITEIRTCTMKRPSGVSYTISSQKWDTGIMARLFH